MTVHTLEDFHLILKVHNTKSVKKNYNCCTIDFWILVFKFSVFKNILRQMCPVNDLKSQATI